MDDATERQIENVRERLEMMLQANDQRCQITLDAMRDAITVSMTANEKKLDALSEFRQMLTEHGSRAISRDEFDAMREQTSERLEQARETVDARFQSELKPIISKLEVMGRPNWALMASIASVFLVLVSGVWLIIGLKIDAAMTPLQIEQHTLKASTSIDTERLRQLENMTAGSSNADAQSRTDRQQLNDRLRQVEGTIAGNAQERRGQIQTINAKLIEIETQFCASDIVRNLLHAADMRIVSILWHKSFPETTMPTDNAFYPKICNRTDNGTTQ